MKGMSCSLDRSSFGTFWVILLSFLVLSLLVQSCRLNQNVLAQAASMNQCGQSETNRLDLPDHEGADIPSSKSFIPQSENMSPTSIGDQQLEKAEVIQKTKKLQMPFIANEGQTDEKVAFYAKTFGGTVFVTKDGEIVYALPNNSPDVETQCLASLMHSPSGLSPLKRGDKGVCKTTPTLNDMKETHPRPLLLEGRSGVVLKEQFVGAKVKTIQGEEKSATKVSYFKGKDPSKWKTNISTYDVVSLGEVYDGIELKLKAYGNNVEKLFCVKPDANPEQIKISLSGAKDCGVQNAECGIENPKSDSQNPKLQINKSGELVAETELGPVKFTKPIAYQEINGKRVEVAVGYRIQESGDRIKNTDIRTQRSEHRGQKSELNPKSTNSDSTNPKSAIRNVEVEVSNPKSKIANHKLDYGFKVASYDKSHDLIIDPLLASTYLGSSDYNCSIAINSSGNIYVVGKALSGFPTTAGTYDTSLGGYSDAFVSKLNGNLTSLLASTYLGGSNIDSGDSIAVDSSGNIYIAGSTLSSDFPTTTATYDTSLGGYSDTFVSKLNENLTSLLASTYLGGSNNESGGSIAVDSSGNIYIAGSTSSSDFPTTTGAYDTSFDSSISSDSYDIFVTKLNGTLTNLLTSTYLGGSKNESGGSIAVDSSGNIFLAGATGSSGFPTTVGAYDASYNSGYDAFLSKLNGDLTSLLASTYLGGSDNDSGGSIAVDSSGNIFMTGYTSSSDFPTTTGAYNTSYNGGDHDAFISKLNSSLTTLLASTYLGGSDNDYIWSLARDSGGNIYVTGYTGSSDFPTTTSTYDTSYNYYDAFVSKLNGNLTSLLASTYLGGSSGDSGRSITIDSSGNIYVAGWTSSSDFPTTTGTYNTSYSGSSYDIFVSKFDSNLSVSPTTATSGSATDVSLTSATLNGTVNANGQSTTVWFQYDTASGSYTNTSSTQTVTGTSDTTVSISVSGLSSGTTYYYRIAVQNSVGTVYGNEMSFTTLSDTATPTGSIIINSNATYTNSPTVTLSLSATDNLGVTGYYLSTSSSTPSALDTGWTSVTSTNSYSSNVSYTLISGDGNKTAYVWFKDNSGNVSSSASDSIILDTTAPVITITSPTSNTTYTVTSSVIAIGGNASDSTSGISSVTWSNDKGGSGTASGTTSWLTSSISLLSGDNVITVTAKDGAGNSGTDTLQVTYSPSGTVTAPSASTGSATNLTSSTATLNGTVNANGASTTVWFQYGTASGSYGNTSSSQVVSGSSNTTVSISISSLSSNTTYYYRIVAANSAGTSYGSEASFATKTASMTPTPTTSPAPTLSPVPTPEVSPTPVPTLPPLPTPIPTLTTEPNKKGAISGYIINKKNFPIESAKLRLKGANSKVFKKTISDENGLFEFTDLDADTYTITAIKKGYKRTKQTATLELGEEKDIEIVMKKMGRKRTVKDL